jgi:hypothetical protein
MRAERSGHEVSRSLDSGEGVEFAVVVVKRTVILSPTQRVQAQRGFSSAFPGIPVVLAQDSRGTPTYWGRPDIVPALDLTVAPVTYRPR